MALWIVFPAVASSIFGLVVWAGAAGAGVRGRRAMHWSSERRAWRYLVGPLGPAVLLLAFLAGWAIREPDPADERITLGVAVLALVVGTIAARALVRAIWSLASTGTSDAPIATVGLVRCRPVVSDVFAQIASREALEAALAHEAAHARARDPIRIWLAQLATDLQWPIPGSQRRYRAWRLALELRRDREAVAAGASPTALAEGILLAARLQRGASHAVAAVVGDGDGLALRVRRLLEDPPYARAQTPSRRRPWITFGGYGAAVAVAVALGSSFGEALLTLVPGVRR